MLPYCCCHGYSAAIRRLCYKIRETCPIWADTFAVERKWLIKIALSVYPAPPLSDVMYYHLFLFFSIRARDTFLTTHLMK